MNKPPPLQHQPLPAGVLNKPIFKMVVNLLPPEVIIERTQTSKFLFIFRLSILAMTVVIITTIGLFIVTFSQSSRLNSLQKQLSQGQKKVESFNTQESYAIILKQRLESITRILQDNKRLSFYNLVDTLTVPGLLISQFNLEKNGSITLTAESLTLEILEQFLARLSNPQSNQEIVLKVNLENVTKAKEGVYKYNITIYPK